MLLITIKIFIGGNGIIVEIDESKFGKRKYHRGDRVEGVWVVGGVERTEERKVFLTTVTNRNSNTMEDIIRKFVAPGSIIHTDCWAAYNMIERMEDDVEHQLNLHLHGLVRNELNTDYCNAVVHIEEEMPGKVDICEYNSDGFMSNYTESIPLLPDGRLSQRILDLIFE